MVDMNTFDNIISYFRMRIFSLEMKSNKRGIWIINVSNRGSIQDLFSSYPVQDIRTNRWWHLEVPLILTIITLRSSDGIKNMKLRGFLFLFARARWIRLAGCVCVCVLPCYCETIVVCQFVSEKRKVFCGILFTIQSLMKHTKNSANWLVGPLLVDLTGDITSNDISL